MATLTDLSNKRAELNAATQAYTQAVADMAAGTATQADVDAAKAAAQAKGDEYAKLAGQTKKDNPDLSDDSFYSNPTAMSAQIRENVRTIVRTGSLAKPYLELIFDTEANTAGNTTIHIPFRSESDVTVDWGDESTDVATSGISHIYATAGVKTVRITGTVSGFNRVSAERNRELKDVSNWGDVSFLGTENMFAARLGATITAQDAPKFAPGASTASMFSDSDFNADISHWDVSNVSVMSNMFKNAYQFNADISGWDVSGVSKFYATFFGADAFNHPLNAWNVSGATDMGYMFGYADAFNQPLDQWDTSNVTNMYGMFESATSFDQDISMWDVGRVTNSTNFNASGLLPTEYLPNFA